MGDIRCGKCKELVLRVRDGISVVAGRHRSNMTWFDGRQVQREGVLACGSCGAEFLVIDAATAETVSIHAGRVPPAP